MTTPTATPTALPATPAAAGPTALPAAAGPTATGGPAVHLRGLRRVFGARAVLGGVDLSIARGEFVALLGASGTGKTTLLRILGALDKADAGTVLVPPVRTVVFQEPRLVPSKRVLANVTVGLPRGAATRETGLRALAEVGLEKHAGSWPATLSGGEAQRVALARALVREPQLLLLDEPFAALDALTRLRMQDLVGDLVRRHRPAVLLVTHDVEEAVRLADRVAVLREGRLVRDERVTVGHPRDPADPAFADLRRRLLADLGVH
ncbi:ABC transporter ATP-binding protein [Streptomyces sp. CB01881]|uniref:ABC transporter ATP-binding protein n=1 Tax=Streptomyces sp. CB01881 TaxID=2078691 RepID=UPI000CDC94E5|nr:ABC transporter ATP-binding protein [Streptomyces sp. CB01881]AUY48928.1 sulfonate ABC transporter ATP-binding protein [Streptomyces sp. CB01881]TYC77417.1 ABC transporter ATP-binding protein [Streptomyces sp. CB01881]